MPEESLKRSRVLFPISTTNLTSECHDGFCERCLHASQQHRHKLSVKCTGSDIERLNNRSREYTIRFQISDNGHDYIALTQYAFSDCICDWLRTALDFYNLKARSIVTSFDTFTSLSLFPGIYESDEEKDESIPLPSSSNNLIFHIQSFQESSDDDDGIRMMTMKAY